MNSVLNVLSRRIMDALLARRWSRVLTLVVAAALAGAGSLTFLKPDASASDAVIGSSSDSSYSLTGRVVRVADGDTFTILVNGKQEKVRMASIDAPEVTKDSGRAGQPEAQKSKDALAALVAGKTLTIRCFERDRYDRNICDVPLGDGMTANQKQVASGMAWANMEGRGKFIRDPGIRALEQQAKKAKLGIWQHADPVSPWAWRYQCWKQQQC